MNEPTGARRYGVGGGDAYYDAVRYGGYEGTREQFGKDQAEFAKNASAVAEAKETVERDTEEVRNTKNTFENTTVPEAIRALDQAGDDQILAITQKGEEVSQQVETVGTEQKDAVANEGRARVQAVEQAGTTQVQAVNDAGTAQVEAVNQAGADQVNAVEQAGADQVQAVTDEGTTQIGAVTDKGDTQVQRVQDKGDEVLDSIPADYTALDHKVDNLKNALKESTGNAIITGWVDGEFVSTNGSTYNPNNPIGNANFRYVFVDCSEGDIFTINGTGGGNPRLWAFVHDEGDTHTVLEPKAENNATADNLVITAPAGTTRLVLNDKNKNKDSYYGCLLVERVADLESETEALGNSLNGLRAETSERLATSDGSNYINPDNYELGNITMSSIGWTYGSSVSRVRTKENYDLELEVGDVVKVKDPTKAAIYIGYQTNATAYGASGEWVSEYTCEYGGKYAILIKELPSETVQSDKYALLNQLEIIRYNNNKQNSIIALSKNPAVFSVNHRGMARNAPENTIPAFAQSKRYGFDYVETDIAWTQDGIAVLLHDRSINRTARNSDGSELSSTINIDQITYEQALTYDFGIWKAQKWAGTKIPTFEQLLTLCKKQGIKINAEVKTYGYTSERLTEIVNMVKSMNAESLVQWASSETSLLPTIKALDPNAPLCLITYTIDETVINFALSLKTETNSVIIMSDVRTEAAINLCKSAGIPLGTFVINNKNTMKSLPLYLCSATSDLYAMNVVLYEASNA